MNLCSEAGWRGPNSVPATAPSNPSGILAIPGFSSGSNNGAARIEVARAE